MKINRETLIVIMLSAAVFLLLCGCSAKKKSVKAETQTEYRFNQYGKAEDELILDYLVDTTKQCETSVVVERIEFYPDQYFDTTEKVLKPKIKAVVRKTINNATTSKGVSVTDVHGKTITTETTMKDSTSVAKLQTKETDVPKIRQWWWLLVIIIVIVAIVRYISR